ncbi:MAG: type VI secretion system baseplate subunit TssG, partial [Bryobacteraceae bacterium]
MGAKGRRSNPDLNELLFQHGYEFDFFQAVRLLTLIGKGRRGVGRAERPDNEVARFGAHLTLSFPPSPVHDIVENKDGPHAVTVAAFGLTGTQGVLPHFYTEHMIMRHLMRDDAMAAFLDLFNHRLMSFFYRAWEKHHPVIGYEQKAATGRVPDNFTQYLFDLVGMGTPGLRGRLSIPDEALLYYGGLVAQRPHSAAAVR